MPKTASALEKKGVAQLVIEFSVWFVVCIPFSRKSQRVKSLSFHIYFVKKHFQCK